MAMDYDEQSEILKALGHPIRLRILEGLAKEDKDNRCNVNKMVEMLKMPQSTVSQHLGILKSRKIIAPRKDGVKTCYEIVNKRVLRIIQILE